MTDQIISKLKILMDKGVQIPNPASVVIDNSIDPERIAGKGVIIHPGCRLTGAKTMIGKGAVLGAETPLTVDNCQIGQSVNLKGGYITGAVFLNNATMGSGAHIRNGTILEEGAKGAHTVGLKETILFPHVTLGSLINFCDCLMAGGTGPAVHSEVGSSYIHFNYTPNQDKATASLIGDVPRGVMLNQPPIFLGGQGGLVGPTRLAYGTVIAAGSIYRKDELRTGRLLSEGKGRGINIPFSSGYYRNVRRIVVNNLLYVANLISLKQWYQHVRRLFVSDDFPDALLAGLLRNVEQGIAERIYRMDTFVEKITESAKTYANITGKNASERLLKQKKELCDKWPQAREVIKDDMGQGRERRGRDEFLEAVSNRIREKGPDYLRVIKTLTPNEAQIGTTWLQGIVDQTMEKMALLMKGLKLTG